MEPDDLTNAFTRLDNALDEAQIVRAVEPDTTVAEALALMDTHNYSQLPVMAGDRVLGVFSYRSLARGVVRTNVSPPIGNYAVEEFVESARFARPDQDFSEVLADLDAHSVVLVGGPEEFGGVLTPMDLLAFLDALTRPFVVLRTIELALRQIIGVCMPSDVLADRLNDVLAGAYEGRPGGVPTELIDLSMVDYVALVRDGRAWEFFDGRMGGNRHRVAARLRPLSELRNDALHFRRELEAEDLGALLDIRDWLLMRLKVIEGGSRSGDVEVQA